MIHNNKEFTQIQGYSDYYICKETSEILSTKERMNTVSGTRKVLKQTQNSKNSSSNYYVVVLVDDQGNKLKKSVHRLLMETFVPNPENKPHVNHIDGNKLNNSMDNLEWNTVQENTQHAVDTGLMTFEFCEKEVHQYTLSGNYIGSFRSDAYAQEITGVAKQNISKNTLGKRPNAGGYQWSRIKSDSIPPYTGNSVPKALHVLHLDTLTTTDHHWSIPALCKELGIEKSNPVAHSIRRRGYYHNEFFRITRSYFE